MATKAKLTVYVTSTRGASQIRIVSNGKYVSTPVIFPTISLSSQPILTTATTGAFWRQVLGIVNTQVNALP